MKRRKHKLVVEYGLNGYVCSDYELEKDVKRWINSEDLSYILVSNESIIQQFRVEVAEGNIHHEDIGFQFDNELILIDENGHLDEWPKGFCDIYDKQLDILLSI